MEEINKEYRTPNYIENFIIKRYVKNQRYQFIEIFILIAFLGFAFFRFAYMGFSEHWILLWVLAFLSLVIALICCLVLITLWFYIKQSNSSREYKIYSDQGEWEFETIITRSKTPIYISKINGKQIKKVIREMRTPPIPKKSKNTEYEYVKLLDDEPLYGTQYIFISINGATLNKKHRNVIDKIKPIGILSIIVSFFFCYIFINFLFTGFKDTNLGFICLVTSFFFFRTILRWRNNKKLIITLNE